MAYTVTWRPTASSGNATAADTGFQCYSGESDPVYTNVHTYIDDTTADDTSTYISSYGTSAHTVSLTFSGTAIPSNGKITKVTAYLRGYSSYSSSVTCNLTFSSIGTFNFSNLVNQTEYGDLSSSINTTATPSSATLTVSGTDNATDDKYSPTICITQIYLVIEYDLYYTISLTQTTGGNISVSSTSVKEGTSITVTTTPSKSYEFSQLVVNGTAQSSKTFTIGQNTTLSAIWLLKFFIQENSTPKRISKVYKKENGSWIQKVSDFDTLFSTTQYYRYLND